MTPGSTSQAITRLQVGEHLRREELADAFRPVLEGTFTGADVAWGALFAALHVRGPTADEMLGLVDAIMSFDPSLADMLNAKEALKTDLPVVAVAGSGKESFKTFNVSTAAAFVAAAHPGLCVIKPAGRATSAATGCSDVLAALGIRLPRSLREVGDTVRMSRIGVFDYHLVARRYGPRYEGRFHHLHPLSHVTPWMFIPFHTDALVFGVADTRVELSASVMAASGVTRAAVVSTQIGAHSVIDEYAPFGMARLACITEGIVRVEHHEHPFPSPQQLARFAQRPSHQANARLIVDVLCGRAPGPAMALTCTNAGLILHTAGIADDHQSGIAIAQDLIVTGRAIAQLNACREASRQADAPCS